MQELDQTKRAWTDADIEINFTYHSPTPEMLPVFMAIRQKAKALAYEVMGSLPDCKERIISLNMCESAVMWANAGVARHGVLTMGIGDPDKDKVSNQRNEDLELFMEKLELLEKKQGGLVLAVDIGETSPDKIFNQLKDIEKSKMLPLDANLAAIRLKVGDVEIDVPFALIGEYWRLPDFIHHGLVLIEMWLQRALTKELNQANGRWSMAIFNHHFVSYGPVPTTTYEDLAGVMRCREALLRLGV